MKKERSKNPHGQYFTPRNVADLMVQMLGVNPSDPILEPSSGRGVFLDALSAAGYGSIIGVEIDTELANHPIVEVVNQSFVTYKPGQKFCAVIGNPPYIRWKDLSQESKQEMLDHDLYGSLFNSLSDFLTVFIAGSVELLEENGELVFITPSFWMHTQHAAGLRNWLLERGQITEIVDFGEATVFEKVASAIVIFKFIKSKAKSNGISLYRFIGSRRVTSLDLCLTDESQFENLEIEAFTNSSHWAFSSREEMKLADALEQDCRLEATNLLQEFRYSSLGDYVDIANGMVSGLDKAFRVPQELESVLTLQEQAACLPVLKAFDLNSWFSSGVTLYIDIPQGLVEDQVIREYPNFYSLLIENREKLDERYSYKREIPFWEWSFRRSESFFMTKQRKGFVPCKERLTKRETARFSLSSRWAVATQDVTAFAPKDDVQESIEYIVAYLNLFPVTSWIRVRGLMKGGIAEFSERPLASIPFRSIDWSDSKEIGIHQEITKLMLSISDESNENFQGIVGSVREQFAQLMPESTSYLSEN